MTLASTVLTLSIFLFLFFYQFKEKYGTTYIKLHAGYRQKVKMLYFYKNINTQKKEIFSGCCWSSVSFSDKTPALPLISVYTHPFQNTSNKISYLERGSLLFFKIVITFLLQSQVPNINKISSN